METETEFHPELTGCKNVYLNGTMFGMTDESVDQITQELHGIRYIDYFKQRFLFVTLTQEFKTEKFIRCFDAKKVRTITSVSNSDIS